MKPIQLIMVYQIRDIHGRKLFERNNPEEIRHYLSKHPAPDLEVWILSGMPGELQNIIPAEQFRLVEA